MKNLFFFLKRNENWILKNRKSNGKIWNWTQIPPTPTHVYYNLKSMKWKWKLKTKQTKKKYEIKYEIRLRENEKYAKEMKWKRDDHSFPHTNKAHEKSNFFLLKS